MKFKLDRISIKPNDRSGFTLIELLIAIALTTIIVAGIGIGLVNILQANEKTEAETASRNNLNRALDFISDDIRTASNASSSAPTWAWPNSSLGSSTPPPAAKLYLQIPLTVSSMTAATDVINLPNHGFANRNAVMFTGSGTIATGLQKNTNTIYYVVNIDNNNFKVAATPGGTPIDLTTSSSGNLVANRLVIYYIRPSTATWVEPNTIYRSVGPCTPGANQFNCDELVDSIADNGLVIRNVTDSRQVTIDLIGQISEPTDPVVKLEVATTTVSTRNTQ
ncbi:MAG: prepilin-type N-terminal cleavage/methylation domain-containing protein [Cyanosarcina radialis HA8281-LM2]|jgi:prepilin-type N-terminal cleavage/methylation domain-containing protein|nr:prepilin-type N-terminal cleavage/methylation domain-containing protein [Cyanosarcina radialis HA8281-LM2]